ncbi:MAG: TerD family protein [Methylococcales bacterium]
MVQVLQKGANVSLTKIAPNCNEITIAVKWVKEANDETEFDIDASAFMLADNNKIRTDDDFIFYNQPNSPDNAVELISLHETNSQFFKIAFNCIPDNIDKVSIVLTLNEAKERQQNFGMLDKITVEILNSNKATLASYVLQDSEIETALILGELYRYNGEWKFKAIGQGYIEGLDILARNYGVDIESDSETTQAEINPELITPYLPKNPTIISYIEAIKPHIEQFKNKAEIAKSEHLSEANTRKEIIDGILQYILGYQEYHIETEQKIPKQPLVVDYLITLKNKATMVVEAKKINQILGDKHISQAVSYAYHLKIDFALLTNGIDWQLYYVKPERLRKFRYYHVFSINLFDFNENMAEKLFSISKAGIVKEKSFEIIKSKINALDTIYDDVILSDEIIEKIASIINNSQEHKITHNEVRNVMERNKLGWLN